MNAKHVFALGIVAIIATTLLAGNYLLADNEPDGYSTTLYKGEYSSVNVYTFPGASGDTINSWRIIDGSIPAGMNINKDTNGHIVLSGTPTVAGTFSFRLFVDANCHHIEDSGNNDVTITVSERITPVSMSVEQGTYSSKAIYTFIGAAGDTINYANVTSGTVPSGMSVAKDSSGHIMLTGTPTATGTFYFVVAFSANCHHVEDGGNLGVTVTVSAPTHFNHTVHYDANGGSGAPADTVVTDTTNGNSTVNLSSSQPTKSGYTFAGWYTAASGGSQVTSVSVGANATTTVYAHWTQNTLSIGSVAKQYAVAGSSVSFAGSCTSSPSGASVSYSATNVQSGLTVNISGNTVTCSSSTVGTYTFTLNASATNYSGSSTTVTVQFVPELAFSNTPTAGILTA